MKVDSVVVGAGIVGLVAAYLEAKKGRTVTIVDAASGAGGLLRSDSNQFGDFDYGTHIGSETGIDELDEFLFSHLNDENCHRFTVGESGNFFNGQLSQCSPFLDTNFLDKEDIANAHYQLVQDSHYGVRPDNLEQKIKLFFGETLFDKAFAPFIKKTFGCCPSLLPASYIHFFDMYRVLAFDALTTKELKNLAYLNDKLGFHHSSPGAVKYYPKQGGMATWINSLVSKLLDMGVVFKFHCLLKKIEPLEDNSFLIFDGENYFQASHLIWTVSSALLGRYLPVNNKLEKPQFRNTGLYDFVFSKPLLTNCYYINNLDSQFLSTRLTCYQNLAIDQGFYGVTVEVLADSSIDWEANISTIKDELHAMDLIADNSECLLEQYRPINEGFPVITTDIAVQLSKLNQEISDTYNNITLLGRSSGQGFFMSELLVSCFEALQ